MDFKCVSVGSSWGCVMEKITLNELFRNMKKQLLFLLRQERGKKNFHAHTKKVVSSIIRYINVFQWY